MERERKKEIEMHYSELQEYNIIRENCAIRLHIKVNLMKACDCNSVGFIANFYGCKRGLVDGRVLRCFVPVFKDF